MYFLRELFKVLAVNDNILFDSKIKLTYPVLFLKSGHKINQNFQTNETKARVNPNPT